MSLSNTNDAENAGKNGYYQRAVINLLAAINSSIGSLGGIDYELRISPYSANKNGTGYTLGDFISRTDIINAFTGVITSTLWFNETTGLTIAQPPIVDLNVFVPPSSVTVSNAFNLEATQLVVLKALQSGTFYDNNKNFVSGDSGAIVNTTATQVLGTAGAGNFYYITSVLVTNSHASVGTLVSLQDDTSAPIPGATGYATSGGGGYTITFPTPVKTPSANKRVMAVCGTTGANVYVSVSGYKGA